MNLFDQAREAIEPDPRIEATVSEPDLGPITHNGKPLFMPESGTDPWEVK